MRPTIPSEILALGHARSAARRARDWAAADRLKAEIEAAGWRVVDHGSEVRIVPAHPADVTDAHGVAYGWSGAVPSRADAPDTEGVSVILIAGGEPDPLLASLVGLRSHAPAGTQTIVVVPAGDPWDALAGDPRTTDPVGGSFPEVVRTAVRLVPAAAWNAGVRRAAGTVVAWLAPGCVPVGDICTPLVAALADPEVAVTGSPGRAGADVRRLAAAAPGPVVAIGDDLLACRRADAVACGPLDERFHGGAQLATWWSLVLRDGPEPPDDPAEAEEAADADADAEAEGAAAHPDLAALAAAELPVRGARALALPLDTADRAAPLPAHRDPAEAARREKRDLYRVIDRFARRLDLLDDPDGHR